MNRPDTLIPGISNTLLSDEGSGIYVLNYLQTEYHESRLLDLIDTPRITEHHPEIQPEAFSWDSHDRDLGNFLTYSNIFCYSPV